MTKDERDKRWQELFDRYDRAVAEFRQSSTLMQSVSPHLTKLITTLDETAAAAQRMMEATLEANRTALSLYRDEHEQPRSNPKNE
jgi:hypothetical protein